MYVYAEHDEQRLCLDVKLLLFCIDSLFKPTNRNQHRGAKPFRR